MRAEIRVKLDTPTAKSDTATAKSDTANEEDYQDSLHYLSSSMD